MAKKRETSVVIVDTNVFLYDPNAILSFPDSYLIVPLIVIEELDKFKRQLDDIGKAARMVIRFLDVLKVKSKLTKGVALTNGGVLRVHILDNNTTTLPEGLDNKVKDNYLLRSALEYLTKGYKKVKIITKDANLRIKADALDIETRDFNTINVEEQNLYKGFRKLQVSEDLLKTFVQSKELPVAKLNLSQPLHTNEYLSLEGDSANFLAKNGNGSASICELKLPFEEVWGIRPRNDEQRFAFEALLNPEIELVTISGAAGTGKTLIAIACGLHQVTETKAYHKLLVARPIIPLGKELGYLPGEMQEKMRPWMQPIFDNLEFILGNTKEATENKAGSNFSVSDAIKDLMQMELLQVEPLTYIRGRSIPQQFLIVDEAQNLSPHEVKTIITRAGEGTKIILTGDPEQIDHPYLNTYSNGLSYTMFHFMDQKIAAHITLKKGERSYLAELASQILD